MAKRDFFKRYIWLIDIIKRKGVISLAVIQAKYQNSIISENDGEYQRRKFIRDKNEIRDIFDIEIKYCPIKKGYYIEDEDLSDNNERVLESYRIINTFQIFRPYENHIASSLPKSGSEHLLSILDAIQKRRKIEFTYQKFVDDILTQRTLDAYFVKEFKGRWYVVGKDNKDKKTKTFALERMIVEPTILYNGETYDIPENLSPDEFFKDSFGIFKLETEPVEITIAVKPLKAKFLKSWPIHSSQLIISENDEETRIRLKLQITHDFIMELLSHGSELKVISPKILQDRIIGELNTTINNYK